MFLVYFLVWGFLFTFSLVIFYWSAVALQCVYFFQKLSAILFIHVLEPVYQLLEKKSLAENFGTWKEINLLLGQAN